MKGTSKSCVSFELFLFSFSLSFQYVRSQGQHAYFLLEKWKKPPRNAEISSRQQRAFCLIINLKCLVRILRYLSLPLLPLFEKLLLKHHNLYKLKMSLARFFTNNCEISSLLLAVIFLSKLYLVLNLTCNLPFNFHLILGRGNDV